MNIHGYEYETYVNMRERLQLTKVIIRDYIYIIKCDNLNLISKNDVSMLEIEQYVYIGKMLGIDVYIEPILFKE